MKRDLFTSFSKKPFSSDLCLILSEMNGCTTECTERKSQGDVPVDCHGKIAQVDCELIVPCVPPISELRTLLLTGVQPIERPLSLEKQCAVLAQVRELKHDVHGPKARRPRRNCSVVYFYNRLLAAGLSGA